MAGDYYPWQGTTYQNLVVSCSTSSMDYGLLAYGVPQPVLIPTVHKSRCEYCGRKNGDDKEICASCGAPL